MEYKNLGNCILLWLVKESKDKGNDGPYRTSMLYKFYSDLPDEYIAKEIKNSAQRELLHLLSAIIECTSRKKVSLKFTLLSPMIGGILWGTKSGIKIQSRYRFMGNKRLVDFLLEAPHFDSSAS